MKFAANEAECIDDMIDVSDSNDNDNTSINVDKLTNKKKEYLKEAILDKNG